MRCCSQRGTARHALRESAVGAPATVQAWLDSFVARTGIDELILTGHVYDDDARKRSFAIAAEALRAMNHQPGHSAVAD